MLRVQEILLLRGWFSLEEVISFFIVVVELKIYTSKVFPYLYFVLLVEHVYLLMQTWLNHIFSRLISPFTQEQDRIWQRIQKVVHGFVRGLSLDL
jgi:hypothetical protein